MLQIEQQKRLTRFHDMLAPQDAKTPHTTQSNGRISRLFEEVYSRTVLWIRISTCLLQK